MNTVQLIGRVTATPELRHTPQGTAVANTNIAVDDGFGDNKKTFFFGTTFWGKTAETAAQHLVKGQRIGIAGRLTQEQFTPKGQDKPVTKTHINVASLTFLDKPKGAEEGSSPTQKPATQPAADDADEIPF